MKVDIRTYNDGEMCKKIYCQPSSQFVPIQLEQMIASSAGDAGGSIQPMPWGADRRRPFDDSPWEVE